MITVSQYKVAHLTPADCASLEHVQQLLDDHAQDGWELITAVQGPGMGGRPVDQMIRSLSNTTSTVFIFKRTT